MRINGRARESRTKRHLSYVNRLCVVKMKKAYIIYMHRISSERVVDVPAIYPIPLDMLRNSDSEYRILRISGTLAGMLCLSQVLS